MMICKTKKVTRAVSLALAGATLSAGAVSTASAHVMYNAYNAYASDIGTDAAAGGTDGWNASFTTPNWVGTASPTTLPFGTTADVVNWAAQLHSAGGSLTVSSQNAHDNYGIWADIDTAKGAWNDKGPDGIPGGASGGQGWGHNTDVGLFKSDVTQVVTFSISSLDPANIDNFGISVFEGMTTAGNYNHHGGWNSNYRPDRNVSPNLAPAQADNPLGTVGLDYLTHGDLSTVSFIAQAGSIYTILLGGYSGAGNFGPHAGYAVSITSSPVPVPAAVWLLGSALAGMGIIGRRREKTVA